MKTHIKIESNVEDARWTVSLKPGEDDDPEVAVDDLTDEQLEIVAKRFKCSPELIQEINWYFNYLRDQVHDDLVSIWQQVSE